MVLVFKPDLLPNCIPHPTQVPPLQSPSNSFMNRERSHSSPGQIFMRRNPTVMIIVLLNIIHIFVTLLPLTQPVVIPQDLGPVRYVDRQWCCSHGAHLFRYRFLGCPWTGNWLLERIRGRDLAGVPNFGFIEFQADVVSDFLVVAAAFLPG